MAKAQDFVVKSIMLDSVMVRAVKAGFSVDDFIDYVRSDTTFYEGFRNLRKIPHTFDSTLEIFDKDHNSIGKLKRSGFYQRNNQYTTVHIDAMSIEGKIYNRRGNYQLYTPQFFDEVFFPDYPMNVEKSKDEDSENESQRQKDAKVIVFNPGSDEVQNSRGQKKKLAIFDPEMQKYYDYSISKVEYKDSISCYRFACTMKDSLNSKEQKEVLLKELVSFFDRENFNVVYRKYSMQHEMWLIDLDVIVEVEMTYINDNLFPQNIWYNGFWDIPFNRPERVKFQLSNFN